MPLKRLKTFERDIIKAQKAGVEYVVFSGGGAKGAAYSGAYSALIECNIMQNVRAVAGSSAGAITAAVVATGITPKKFEEITKNINLKDLLGKQGILMFNKDGTPLYELIKDTVRSNVANYLNDIDISTICTERMEKLKLEQEDNAKKIKPYMDYYSSITKKISDLKSKITKINDLDVYNLTVAQINLLEKQEFEIHIKINEFNQKDSELQSQAQKIKVIADDNGAELIELKNRANANGTIYFKDLGLLNLVNPERFKDLLITATRRNNGAIEIFSPQTTPDVEIALAAKASASIPVVFQPVTINGVEYVDGGYRDNTPITHFNKSQPENKVAQDITGDIEKVKEAKHQNRTLAFAFGSNEPDNPLHVAIYSAKEKIINPSAMARFLMDVVYKIAAQVGGNFQYNQSEQKNYEKIRQNALNMVMVDTKGITTLSFNEAQNKASYLHAKGYIQTMEHMCNHELGTKLNKNIEHMGFMIEVFEKVEQSVKSSWNSKVKRGREVKAKTLLEFCKPENWKGSNKEELLEKYLVLSATNFREGKLSESTSTIGKIVDTLNSSKTPSIVKKDYAKVLNLDISNINDIGKLKFKKEDFKIILDRNKDNINLNKGRTI